MKHRSAILFMSLVCGVVGFSTMAQSGMPEKYGVPQRESRMVEYQEESIEITGKNGNISISTPRRVEVTVYTILGQVVMMRVVNPGVSEIKVENRGVYLVKVEGRTQKVAL